jgi:hypothetical protein
MIFDLGCCCNISTGNYDLYGGATPFGSIQFERYNIFAKTSARAENLSQYSHTPGDGSSPAYRHITTGNTNGNITNYINGIYVPRMQSGIDLRYAGSPQCVISVLGADTEQCWVVRNNLLRYAPEENIRMLYDPLNGTGVYYNQITAGTGASYDNSGTITLLTNDETTGAYINIPITDTGALTYLNFDVNPSFDKTILIRFEADPSYYTTYPNSGYEMWIEGNINPLRLGKKSNFIHQSGVSSIPFSWRPDIGIYQYLNLTGSNTGEYIHYDIVFNMPTYDSNDPIYMDDTTARNNDITGYPVYNNIQIRMVDNISGRTIDDVSGFQLKLSNLDIGMTQRTLTTGIREEDVYDEFDEYLYTLSETGYFVLTAPGYVQFRDILLLDMENNRLLYRRAPSTGNLLGEELFNTDYGKKFSITGAYQPTGYFREMDLIGNAYGDLGVNNYSSYGSFFTTDERNTKRAKYNWRTWEKYTTSGINTDLLKYIEKSINNAEASEMVVSRDGSKLAFISMESQFTAGKLNSLDTTVNYGTGGVTPDLYQYYDVILEYDKNSGLTFRFGEAQNMQYPNYIWGLANYETYGNFIFGAPHTQYSAIDLTTVNEGYNIPCIEKFCSYDYPKCFSLRYSKDKYIYVPDSSEMVQPIEDTVQILFGDMVERTYNIEMRVGNSSGWGHLPVTPFSPSSFSNPATTGYVADIDVRLIHGDPSGSIFWEDSYEVDRAGTILHGGGTTGIARFSNGVGSVGARVLYGDCYNGEIPGAIFVNHRYEPRINGNSESTASNSGTASSYCKVRIGTNTVFDQQIYGLRNLWLHDIQYNPPQYYETGLLPAFGLTALYPTESAQSISGSGAAFVWFETLFSGALSILNSGELPITGYKMHVTNTVGTDLWTRNTSIFALTNTGEFDGYNQPAFTYMMNNKPRVAFSSDRFFYVGNFIMDYPEVWMIDSFMRVNTTGQVYDFGLERYTKLDTTGEIFQIKPNGFSGVGEGWAFSHDGRAIMPIGYYTDEGTPITYYESGGYSDDSGNFGASTRYYPYTPLRFLTQPPQTPSATLGNYGGPYIMWSLDAGENIYYDCIKRSNRHPDAPSYSAWVFDPNDLTGVNPKYWDFFGETAFSGIIGSGLLP